MVRRDANKAIGGQVFERKRQSTDLKIDINTVRQGGLCLNY